MKFEFLAFLEAVFIPPLLILLIGGALNLLYAFMAMWCWNQLADVFSVSHLTYWQTWGGLMLLMIVSDIFHGDFSVS